MFFMHVLRNFLAWLQVATAQLQVRKADLDADNAAHKIEQLQDELQV